MIARELVLSAEREVFTRQQEMSAISRENQERVLEAFWAERVNTSDLQGSTGYGIGDEGRDKLERVFARVFQAQAALVRPQIVSGTHALRLGLFACVLPGDEVLFATGSPYDTLESVVGIRKSPGSLTEWGVTHRIVPLSEDGTIDVAAVLEATRKNTRLVMFQRSTGYSQRKALSIRAMTAAFHELRAQRPDIIIGVDNCYGEFTENGEPCSVGANLVMGSLIKNPGGGVATTGGYVAGDAVLVERAAAQLTAPGVGAEVGPSHDFLRPFYQGLFLAPSIVGQAVRGSILASNVLARFGLSVSPEWNEERSDLILSVALGTRERLLAFCNAVQASAPIDAHVRLDAAQMAGYQDAVVMAAGSFVQGGSLELSADAPMRPPYTAYFQGGLTYEHIYIAMEKISQALLEEGLTPSF